MSSVLADITKGAFKFALQLVEQPSEAHDVLQDAAAIALSHPSAPPLDSQRFKPWFYKVVRNKSIDLLRKTKRYDKQSCEDETSIEEAQHCPRLILENAQTKKSVKAALDELPLHQRELIVLKDYHDLSYQEIARILSIPKGSVMSGLHRARCALKIKLMPMMEE